MILIKARATHSFLVEQDVGVKNVRFNRHPYTATFHELLHRNAETLQGVNVVQYVDAECHVKHVVLQRFIYDVSHLEP